MGRRFRYPPRKRSSRRDDRAPVVPGADPLLKPVFAKIGVPDPAPFVPDPFQTSAVESVSSSDCLVTAPTGAGKTWIAETAIGKILGDGGRSWYACPLKALSNAKHAEFSERFGAGNVGILTGDRRENPNAPVIVGTTEILRNQLYDAMSTGSSLDADFVVLDEAHFLGDEERGVVWEETMIYLPTRIPLLLLSATIGNAEQIARWLSGIRGRQCRVIAENHRPVPLVSLFLHPNGTLMPLFAGDGKGRRPRIYKKVVETLNASRRPSFGAPWQLPPFGAMLKVLRRYQLLPAIFFLKSRSDCGRAIGLCLDNTISDPDRKGRLSRRFMELTQAVPRLQRHHQRWQLENLGVGAHHSGQLPAWKLLLETLMTEGLLDAVFATSTVAAGVNFPARTIVFFNSDRFNGRDFVTLSPTEFHQMTGRAGRRGMDNIGFAVAVPGKYMDIPKVAQLVTSKASDVDSQLRIDFSMVLNLLLSHTPEQINGLLRKSFATYQAMKRAGRKASQRLLEAAHGHLWEAFERHLDFLQEMGYVDGDNRLTPEGAWASQLRVDQPLLIAEAFRRDALPSSDVALLAGLVTCFVNETESRDQLTRKLAPRKLMKAYGHLKKKLTPFQQHMAHRGFYSRPFYSRPALTLYLWASMTPWEKVVAVSELEEGNLAMLILRTADNLRHIISLDHIFPETADTARAAIEVILRDPVVVDLPGQPSIHEGDSPQQPSG
ncbi:MAG: DEAD/DEAH box helicase [Desulfobacterales bacterium]